MKDQLFSFFLLIGINAYASEVPFSWIKHSNYETHLLRKIWEFFPEGSNKTKYRKSDLMRNITDKFQLHPALEAIRLKNYDQLDALLPEYESDVSLRNQVLGHVAGYKKGDVIGYIYKLKLNYLDWNNALYSFLNHGDPGIDINQMLATLRVLIEAGASVEKIAEHTWRYGLNGVDASACGEDIIKKSCFFSWSQEHCTEFTPDVQNKVMKLLIDGGPLKLR